jgi:acyl-coenzyme A thioesterase PaaI-like protein
MIGYLSPRVLHLDANRCEVLIPLRRRAKNHLSSMYFGALCVGADCAGGLIAFEEASKSAVPVNIVFKSIRGDFLKRPQADVHFVCEDGEKAREIIERTVSDGERHEREVEIKAYTYSPHEELVAQFYLTLSVRVRRRS